MTTETKPPTREEILAKWKPTMDQAVYACTEPEPYGKIPVRTELTVLSADDPQRSDLGFTVYELIGSDVHPLPEGQEPSEEMLAPENILTGETDLKEGMRLLVLTLFGWCLGVVSLDEKGSMTCSSPNGATAYFLQFVNDRPPQEDGTPAPPRWVCTGSANLRGIKKMEILR